MGWALVLSPSTVTVTKLGRNAIDSTEVLRLLPGLVEEGCPMGEIPRPAYTFISQLLEIGGKYPPIFFLDGWISSSSEDQWWSRMVGHVLERFNILLNASVLDVAVRATQYGFSFGVANFFIITKCYDLDTQTF